MIPVKKNALPRLLGGALVMLVSSGISFASIVASPEISGGKQKVTNSTMVAIKVGSGYTKVLWYYAKNLYDGLNSTAPIADYLIQTSSNSTTGIDGTWSTAVTVTGNTYSNREHRIDFTGKTWVRMYRAAGLPAPDRVEVHDASNGCADTYFFLGNSVTGMGFQRYAQPDFQADINAQYPAYSPVMINGGIGGQYARDGAARIDQNLADFPDMMYWCIEFGTNDSWGGTATTPPADEFRTNMQTIITKIKAANRIPLIAHIGWNTVSTAQPRWNLFIDTLTQTNNLMAGPDMYTYFQAHQNELVDGVHPTNPTGMVSLNRLWAQNMIADGIYSGSVSATPRTERNPVNMAVAFAITAATITGRTISCRLKPGNTMFIYTAAGDLLKTITAGHEATVQWQAASAGVYFVNANNCMSRRFAVK